MTTTTTTTTTAHVTWDGRHLGHVSFDEKTHAAATAAGADASASTVAFNVSAGYLAMHPAITLQKACGGGFMAATDSMLGRTKKYAGRKTSHVSPETTSPLKNRNHIFGDALLGMYGR